MKSSFLQNWSEIETWNEDAQRFASAFRHAAIGMALVSPQGRFMQINKALIDLTGYSEEALMALDFQSITHPDDLKPDLEYLHQLLRGEIESFRLEKRYRHKQGHWIWALLSVSMVSDQHGKPLYFISQVQDITAQKEAEAALQAAKQRLKDANHELAQANAELRNLAQHDSLTGLKNRRAFDERLREEVARSRRTGQGFSLFLLDIDHFKKINDGWGHAVGDQVLREVAQLLEETLRTADGVTRYGGEEFALILPDTGIEGGIRAAERCRAAIASHPFTHGPVTASCGVATWQDEDEQTLLVRADLALYSAKQDGRDRVCHSQLPCQEIASEKPTTSSSEEKN